MQFQDAPKNPVYNSVPVEDEGGAEARELVSIFWTLWPKLLYLIVFGSLEAVLDWSISH